MVERYRRFPAEGRCSQLFSDDTESIGDVEDDGPAVDTGVDDMELVPNLKGDTREDITRFALEGFEVDDDNEPDEENVPAPIQTSTNEMQFQQWDSNQTCNRKSEGHTEENTRLLKTPEALTRLGFFILFLPTKYIKETLLLMTSNAID